MYVHEYGIYEHQVIWYVHKINFSGDAFDINVHTIHTNVTQTNVRQGFIKVAFNK